MGILDWRDGVREVLIALNTLGWECSSPCCPPVNSPT